MFSSKSNEFIDKVKQKWFHMNKNLEYIFGGEREFIDDRGKISNYDLPEPINMIGYIESKKGTIRANHYHPVQEQKCLLVQGQFISIYQDLLGENSQKRRKFDCFDRVLHRPNFIIYSCITISPIAFKLSNKDKSLK